MDRHAKFQEYSKPRALSTESANHVRDGMVLKQADGGDASGTRFDATSRVVESDTAEREYRNACVTSVG